MANSSLYISNCFKYSPKEQVLGHLEPDALHMKNNVIGLLSYTIHKNKLKMEQKT